jgi:hypothetical protein
MLTFDMNLNYLKLFVLLLKISLFFAVIVVGLRKREFQQNGENAKIEIFIFFAFNNLKLPQSFSAR